MFMCLYTTARDKTNEVIGGEEAKRCNKKLKVCLKGTHSTFELSFQNFGPFEFHYYKHELSSPMSIQHLKGNSKQNEFPESKILRQAAHLVSLRAHR